MAGGAMFAAEQLPYTCSAAVLMSLQPILVTLSKNKQGQFDYSVPTSTMLSETVKLGISAVMLAQQMIMEPKQLLGDEPLSEFVSYAIPGLIYFINNNCLFFILQEVDPTTFQLLSQMKTIFTGLLFRVFLNRQITPVQYLALVTLACGTACSQLPSVQGQASGIVATKTSSVTGLLLSVFSSMMSALGGIYSEKLLKGRASTSIHWQNIQLYIWGVFFNGAGVYMKDSDMIFGSGVLAGFHLQAWLVVLCNALNGLAISAVLKHADNIARVYAHAIAMMATMLVSIYLFGAPITPQLALAIVLVATSTMQYNMPSKMLIGESEPIEYPHRPGTPSDPESECTEDSRASLLVGFDQRLPSSSKSARGSIPSGGS